MAYANTSIASRIESRIQWCQRLSAQACAPLEIAGWRAEAEGLRDALLERDHTTQYQQGPTSVFERYARGLQDGDAMLRTALVHQQFTSPSRANGLTRRYKKIMGRVSSHSL
jgi:hypothetical protein